MNVSLPENAHVQLVAVDHESLFAVVLYAWARVQKGADRTILHRAVLSLDYRADSDEVNRLRALQHHLRQEDGEVALIDELEARIDLEYGKGRSAYDLARMEPEDLRSAAIRWAVVGKKGGPVRVSPELIGLLTTLYPDDLGEDGFPAFLEGTDAPVDETGLEVFNHPGKGPKAVYRPPDSVMAVYKSLTFVDRPSLDAAIDSVIPDGDAGEEVATWLEADFEALTRRYEIAAAGRYGVHYRYA